MDYLQQRQAASDLRNKALTELAGIYQLPGTMLAQASN